MHIRQLLALIVLASICPLAIYAQPMNTPDAPEIALAFMDGAMELTLLNENPLSNNFEESFSSIDPSLQDNDNLWLFEGYQIYQVQLDFDQLDFLDPDVARLAAQFDLANDYDDLFVSVFDSALETCATTQMVSGSNSGLQQTFELTVDMWTGEPFVEGEVYCYIALAYATHPDGESDECPELPYTYVRSLQAPQGGLSIYCKTASNPVGIAEQNVLSFSFYPNPVSTQIHLQWTDSDGTFEILDVSGRVLYSEIITEGNIDSTLDLSETPEGIYLARFSTSTRVETQRLLVRH